MPFGLATGVDPNDASARFKRRALPQAQGPRTGFKSVLALFQIVVEPVQRALVQVREVRRVMYGVSFIRIDHGRRGNAKRTQSVTKLQSLRRRAFDISGADVAECRRAHLMDEINSRRFCVYVGIVVNRYSKVRNHPLIDAILAVIGLPVADAGTGHRCLEAIGLRHGPHRHEAAVAVASNAQSFAVDRPGRGSRIKAGQDVSQIAMTEVTHIRGTKSLSLTVTATRIG